MDILRKKDAILQYADFPLPAPAATVEVASGVRWLRMPLPFDLDHINLWLVADGDQWVAVDTGISSDATREAWQPILADHSLSRLLVTHMHPDHVGLATWLQQQTGAPLAMTLGEFSTAHAIIDQIGPWSFAETRDLYLRHGLSAEHEAQLSKRGSMYKRGVPEMPASYFRLIDGDRVRIGAHDWEVICGYGHSPEHACFHSASLGVLIAGDMVLPRISTNVAVASSTPQDDPVERFLTSIDRLRLLPADTLVLPSHGRPFRGLHARIDQLHAHHQERCEALVEALDRPKSAAELLPVLFSRVLNDPLQVFFALGESVAHLNHLVRTGRLGTEVRDSVIHYVRT